MRVPEPLATAIADEMRVVDPRDLERAAEQLSRQYRAGKFASALSNPAYRAAYLAARLPATYAANVAVLHEFVSRVPAPVRSMLDLGAGPGTAMWAATEVLPSLQTLTAVERDAALIDVGKRMAAGSNNAGLHHAAWTRADIRDLPPLPRHALVVLSYVVCELPVAVDVVRWAWELADVALIVIEPGTPAGFGHIIRAREVLIGSGAQIAAPCPHHDQCPLAVRNDWCHFSVRLERTSAHRKLKGGELGYEDEKYSYVIATKTTAHPAAARIVRHPLKHSGHVKLTLCTPEDLQQPTITKSQKDLYRAARNALWGDEWPPPQ